MENNDDRELYRLFGEMNEPELDDNFTEQVARKISRYRFRLRILQIILGVAGAVVVSMLTPWVIAFTAQIAVGTTLLARNAAFAFFSPAGCAVGLGAGLLLLFKART